MNHAGITQLYHIDQQAKLEDCGLVFGGLDFKDYLLP